MTASLEQSIKSKLRVIAKESNRDPADLWQTLMLERFLVRLSRSPHQGHFVLKGGVLLSKYIEIGRETRDLDFLARQVSHEIKNLRTIFKEIAETDLSDGFTFQDLQVSELTHPHMLYSGAEVSMLAYFGKIRSKVNIDIGFGDLVDPIEKTIPLIRHSKGPLFENEIQLTCYPKEFIFSEKLETIIHRGAFNSRMKDFHDLHSLISTSQSFPFFNLKETLQNVFKHRKTPLTIPILFKKEEIFILQQLWRSYLKNLRTNDRETLPQDIDKLVIFINQWLQATLS